MEAATKIISYKSTLRVKRFLDKYSLNLKTSKAKIINYAFFEMFIKKNNKVTPEVIAKYIVDNTFKFKKENYTLHILVDYDKRISELKKEVEIINRTEYHDNEFRGILLSFYIDKFSFMRKKKVSNYLKEDVTPQQVGLYFNTNLMNDINELCKRYQLNAGMLIFDILTDVQLGNLPFESFPKDVVIESSEKERIIVYLPILIHQELKNLPLTNSFVAEIRAEQFLKKFKLKKG